MRTHLLIVGGFLGHQSLIKLISQLREVDFEKNHTIGPIQEPSTALEIQQLLELINPEAASSEELLMHPLRRELFNIEPPLKVPVYYIKETSQKKMWSGKQKNTPRKKRPINQNFHFFHTGKRREYMSKR